jgi:lipopolysaccharide transport system ATP-binding protein
MLTESHEDYDPGLITQSATSYEENGAIITNPRIITPDGRQVNLLQRNGQYIYVYDVEFTRSVEQAAFGVLIKTVEGLELGGASTIFDKTLITRGIKIGDKHQAQFGFHCRLAPRMYFMNAGVVNPETWDYYHRILDAHAFRVQPDPTGLMTGMVDFGIRPLITSFP